MPTPFCGPETEVAAGRGPAGVREGGSGAATRRPRTSDPRRRSIPRRLSRYPVPLRHLGAGVRWNVKASESERATEPPWEPARWPPRATERRKPGPRCAPDARGLPAALPWRGRVSARAERGANGRAGAGSPAKPWGADWLRAGEARGEGVPSRGSRGERRVCARAWLSPPLTPPLSDKGQAVWAWTSAFADSSHGGT